MAQLNDLLVMGQSTLLGPVNVLDTVTAEKFEGDGSGLKKVLIIESFDESTGTLTTKSN